MFNEYLQKFNEFGVVQIVKTNLVVVAGLPNVSINELVIFESGDFGQVYSLDKDNANILILSRNIIHSGMRVARTNSHLSTLVGDSLIGRVINPFGITYDNKGVIENTSSRSTDNQAADLSLREKITQPLVTGTSLVDVMVPLGKGQRELVLGDRKTGKSSFLLTTLKNQVNQGALGIYALIGKRKTDFDKVYEFCLKEQILDKVIIIVSFADDPASIIFQTPYAAMTIAEYFRDQGKDTILVLDDLSTHARFYREISLLSNTFPGRESYPGDIFYVHSRLLERAGNFKYQDRSVSITCLPVAETMDGDLSSYISTNLMGMTDGHIYFDINSYNQGLRPAINIQLSVTRVGKQTQSPLKKELNTYLNKFLIDYQKMENFSHFGAELSEDFTDTILTGQRLLSFFGQNYTEAIPESIQLVILGFILNRDAIAQSKKDINDLRIKLTNIYYQNQAYFDSLIKSSSKDEFLQIINSNRGEIIKLCNL